MYSSRSIVKKGPTMLKQWLLIDEYQFNMTTSQHQTYYRLVICLVIKDNIFSQIKNQLEITWNVYKLILI